MFSKSQKKKDKEFRAALEAGDLSAIEACLKGGANAVSVWGEFYHQDGYSSYGTKYTWEIASHHANHDQDKFIEILKVLLDNGLDPNYKSAHGESLLYMACAFYRENSAYACGLGIDPRVVELLVRDYQADPLGGMNVSGEHPDFSYLPLRACCNDQRWDRAKTLILFGGADQGCADWYARMAIEKGMPTPVLKLLIDRVQNINFKQDEILRQAIVSGRKDIFDYIVETKKPDLTAVYHSEYGSTTLLEIALCEPFRMEIAEELVRHGAKVDARLFGVIAQEGAADLLNLVLDINRSAGISYAELDLQNALFAAVKGKENPEVIRALVNAGADVNAKDDLGMTPIMHAADVGNAGLIDVLESLGGKWEGQDEAGFTAYDHLVKAISFLDVNAKLDESLEPRLEKCLRVKETRAAMTDFDHDRARRSACLRQKFEKVNDHSVKMAEGEGLTITFNFFMQQVFYRGLGDPSMQMPVMNFKDLPNPAVLEEAYDALIDMGGSAPPPDVIEMPGKARIPTLRPMGGGV